MLEGHVLRELLDAESKSSYLFSLHEIFHGVTAPGFLFGAGFTFAIVAQRRWEQSTRVTKAFFRRVWRAISLILIGYALHVPFLSLQKILAQASTIQWNAFLLFDVLQSIGLGLLFLRFLLVLIREERLFLITITALLFIVVYSTPIFWTTRMQQFLPMGVFSSLNGLTGSPFPIFPFTGFLFAGALVSWIFLRAAQRGFEEFIIKAFIIFGAGLAVTGVIFDALPFQTYTEYSFWNTSPNYFWIRLGILLVMLGGLWYLEDFISTSDGSITRMPKWLTILGVESLFVYIAHLLILCGWVTNTEFNLRYWFGGKLHFTEAILVFSALTLVMVPASFVWRHLKKQHPKFMIGIYWWIGFSIAWSFFFNPY